MSGQLPRIFTSIGEDYDERVLPSITTEVLKAVVVSISQKEELLMNRSYVWLSKMTNLSCINYRVCVCVWVSHRLGLMLVSSSPRESSCLGRSVRTLQKEPPPSALSWMMFHWYEAAGKTFCISYFFNTVSCFDLILTVENN